jgi:hypothetical protein
MSRSRSVSISSDAGPKASLSSPPPVDPSPAFIAASSASQIVSADMEQNEMASGNGDDVSLTSNGLVLLNGFLDYLLFSFLASAKSTQLSALRPAIADVLKPRLAREVVSTADEELREYMGGGGDDDDELQEFRGGRAPHGEFDLVRAWKLARLRCMVYTRLGDLEEEEEDEYIAREGLDEAGGAPRRFSGHAGNITPAAAIFLTSIIENMGEHALAVACENARNRYYTAARLAPKSSTTGGEADIKITVDESDMEKLALNPTLGRLWRTWKKGIRSPALSRAFSRESFARRSTLSNKGSANTLEEVAGRESRIDPPVEEEEENRPKSVEPADIALPINDDDVKEIEIPGICDVEEAEPMQAAVAQKVRPRSLIVSRSGSMTPTSSSSPNGTPGTWPATNSPQHARSQSVPVHHVLDIFKSSDHGKSLETVAETEGNEAAVTAEASVTTNKGEEEATSHTSQNEASNKLADEDKVQPLIISQQKASSEDIAQNSHDRRSSEDEIVEGQGTYQRPNLNNISLQRPKRKISKDTAPKKEALSIDVAEPQGNNRDDHQPPMQGGRAVVLDASSSTQQKNASPAGDPSNPLLYSERSERISHGSAPTSHPRQLETNIEPSTKENSTNVPRDSLNTSPHTSSLYSESIGAPHSTSDDSEGSVYRSIPSRAASRAASHAASIRSQPDHSTPRDRVAVQRVYVGSSTSQASIRSRRSGSISDKRPLTSGSATSNVSTKLKVLIGRHPADIDVPLPAPPRRSSDASKFTSEDADETTLDQLIKSDETIRFTLTPRTMREIEVSSIATRIGCDINNPCEQLPSSPRWNTARNDIHNDRTDTSDLADFFRNTAPPGEPLPSPRIPIERDLPTPRTKPSSPAVESLRVQPKGETLSEKSSPISVNSPGSPVSQVSNRSRATMHQARAPRATGDSVRDFAQFIRSTGPGAATPKARPEGNTTRSHFRDGSDSVIGSSRPDTAQSGSSRATAKPRESYNSARKNGLRLEARDASGHNGSKTSDLIDFIREGPPGASTHRIPRTVAPFRNTMDSEDLLLIETVRVNEARITPSLASTGAESTSSSRSPLLTKLDAPPIPVRKRRGPRDPYAIDLSDDEGFEEPSVTAKISKAPRAEESLLDFLNSVPPPVSHKAPEPFILSSHPMAPNSSSGQSTSNTRSRFRRNTFVDKLPGPTLKKSMTSMRSAKLSSKSQISSPVQQSSRRPPVPMVPKLDGQPDSQFNFGNGSAFQPSRSQLHSTPKTETGALADFFRNTGPPESMTRASSTFSEDKKDSSFSKFFRRKRVEA